MNFTGDVLFANLTNITKGDTGMLNPPSSDPRVYEEGERELLLDIYFYINGVVQLTICCIGASTNILNIIALSRSAKLATYKILIAMAVADLMVMVILGATSIAIWIVRPTILYKLQFPNAEVPYSLYFWQNIWFHAANIFWAASAWCACILVIFRLIVISFPLKAPTLASGKRVNAAIAAVYVGSLLIQAFMWQMYELNEGVFETINARSSIALVYTVFTEQIPYLICIICTILLILQLHRSSKQMRYSINENQMKERTREQKQLTRVLILVVSLYILTNTPTMVYFFMKNTNTFVKRNISKFEQNIFYLVAGLSALIGNASNFFIYILANPTFRKDLLRLFAKNRTIPSTSSKESETRFSCVSGIHSTESVNLHTNTVHTNTAIKH